MSLLRPATALAILAVTACSPVAGAQSESEAPSPDFPLPSHAELTYLLEAFDVPGMAFAQITDCEVDGVVVAGQADLSEVIPVTPNTAFEAASMSKPVFAWLVMSLVDEGLIDLDKPLAEDFDYERIPDKVAYAEVTPRMILKHRAGFPNWVDEATPFHERTALIPFETEPGAAFGYSGEGFQLLQAYVEDLTGQTLEALFQERLGEVMPDSTFVKPLPEGVAPSRGYQLASAPDTGRDLHDAPGAMAASSLFTTAGDYAHFLSMVCKEEGLEPATYEEMLAPQSDVPEDGQLMPTSWALGWMVSTISASETFVGHAGNNDEYRSLAGLVPQSGGGIVILTNGARGEDLINAFIMPPAE